MNKNFVARVSAIINNFQRNIRKAQQMAKTSIPDEIETEVTANISRFQRAINRAKAMAQRWREHKVEIDANATPIQRVIATIKGKLNAIRDKKVDIDGDASPLNRVVAAAKARLAMWRKHTVKLDIDTTGMTKMQSAMAIAKRSLEEYQNKMDSIASNIRTFGTIFSQQVKGLMIASIQALIPVIASLVPAIMAVLNAVGVLGGGVIGLAGAFGIAGAGAMAFGIMAASAIKMLNDGTLKATAETRRYQSALQQVQSTWAGIIKQNQAQIFNTLANGLQTVNVALQRMTPFLSGVAKGMEQASAGMLKWAQHSQTASKFFNMMNTTGVKTFNTLLSAAGRFGDGLVNVFTQLAPLFLWTAQQLNKLGASFQKWANSAAGQNAIRSFIEYTKTNLPKIGQIFANVFAGIGNLMAAFAQNSAGIFDWLVKLTGQFRAWSEQVGKSEGFKKFVQYVQQNGPVIGQLIGNIVRALIAFGTAMAPIASVILKFVTALAGFIAKLFETHPAIARTVGIMMMLGGIFWALMAPVLAVSSVLSNVFGTSLLSVIGHIARFISSTGILRTVLTLVQGAFRLLMNPIATIGRLLPLLSGAFEALGAVIAGISWPILAIIAVIGILVGTIIYLWKTNEGFRQMITEAWNGIVTAISGAISSIINWFMQLWASIQQTLQPIMPILQMLGQVFMQVLGVIVMGIIQALIFTFQSLWTAVSVIFTAIGGIISVVVQIIVGLFTALIQLLTGDFSGAWLTLQNMVSNVMNTIWNTLVSIWNQISNFIFSVLNRILGTNITSWGQIWSAITGFVTRIWNSVSSWFGRVVSTVGSKMVQAWNYVKSHGAQWVTAIISAMGRFVQGVVSGFFRVVSSVGNGMRNAVNKVKSFASSFVSAGLDMMRGLVNGIKQGASAVIEAAKSAASNALKAAKSMLGIHSPSREFMSVGMFTMQGFAIGIDKHVGSAVSSVKQASRKVMDAFQPELSSDLATDLKGGLNSDVNAHMSRDVRHSMQENNKPVVNVTVRNESDIPAIKSYIEDSNSKDASFDLY
ncbi:phage tail protein [Staphylococcus warneri]|uniref:phage tail protein n=1 Tax=Staphylococcus warneri TaxID=1292 RepID=UPI000D1D3CC0|nr:terminase [Staphylococcus warneri]PTI20881.1 terminase [Staphylococcus warneri]PTI26923.1 terminase [Staphylococcus warneri]RIM99650.1 terminase [Staphylococcus warneri]RIN05597.1 terminase [Staphylococcus warneri]